MTLDDSTNAGAGDQPPLASHVSGTIEHEALQANFSAIATARTGSLQTTGSAIGFATVSGDASLTASAVPVVFSKGDVSLRQCYTSAVIAAAEMNVSQAGAPLIIGKKLDVRQGGAMVMLSGESTVSNGFVGVLLAPKATVAEDSRVLIGTKAALIIAAALLGGFGLVALVMVVGARRIMTWRRHVALPHVPKLAELQKHLHQMKGCQCGRRR